MKYEFSAELWLYQGDAPWHFITLPEDISAEIKKLFGLGRTGWGSIKVTASIGEVSWKSSIFPDKKSNSYLLPIKAEIRQKAGISVGHSVEIKLELHP